MNVSSIVVKTTPEYSDEVMADINSIDRCEVHFHDEIGRIIVTIEGENVSEEIKKMKLILGMPNVLSADLIYSYSEEELANAMEHFREIEDAVPDALKDDTPDACNITYNGHVKEL